MSLPQTPLGPVCWPAFLAPCTPPAVLSQPPARFLSSSLQPSVMDVDSCMNSLCKTRLFSSKDDAFQILL